MARFSKVLFGLWLAGMLASGSAGAAVIDLGVLTPGAGKGLFGMLPLGTTTTDTYMFDIGGTVTGHVGASAISLLNNPTSPPGVVAPLTADLREWNGSAFTVISGTAVTSNTGAILTSADLPPAAGGNGIAPDRHYELVISASPGAGAGVATYGGSLSVSAVPEPSSALLLLGGVVSMLFLGRRRLLGSSL